MPLLPSALVRVPHWLVHWLVAISDFQRIQVLSPESMLLGRPVTQ